MKLDYRVPISEEGLTIEKLMRTTLGFSRNLVRRLKRCSGVMVNGQTTYMNRQLKEGDQICINMRFEGNQDILPQPIHLDIIFEDKHLLVVNKPSAMLVHPLKHEPYNTLTNALLYYYRQNNLELTSRLITRLDRNTSGLVVVAKHAHAGFRLSQQLHTDDLQREYLAVVQGRISQPQGIIDLPIAPCEDSKIKHTVHPGGRRAVTHYYMVKYLEAHTLVRLQIETGRTHQIRVHMSHIGHSLVGDTLYGGNDREMKRQALHCCRVKITHPITECLLEIEAPVPEDMQVFIDNKSI